MKILVTGATGFLGRHLVPILKTKHEVTALTRDISQASNCSWLSDCVLEYFDITQQGKLELADLDTFDVLVHLAWAGLPNYCEFYHLEKNMMADYFFIKNIVEHGIQQVMVAGTCMEYGMQNGCLAEEIETAPTIPYSLAKDTLRKLLQQLQTKHSFRLQWTRLFYMYGKGQSSNSLLSQLQRAIDDGDLVFNMSKGEQLRDYLQVEQVADYMRAVIEDLKFDGIVNICRGEPVSVRTLVEQFIHEQGADIQINPGYYPYPDYEPMAFWGNNKKLLSIIY